MNKSLVQNQRSNTLSFLNLLPFTYLPFTFTALRLFLADSAPSQEETTHLKSSQVHSLASKASFIFPGSCQIMSQFAFLENIRRNIVALSTHVEDIGEHIIYFRAKILRKNIPALYLVSVSYGNSPRFKILYWWFNVQLIIKHFSIEKLVTCY